MIGFWIVGSEKQKGRSCRESGDGGVGDKGSGYEWELITVCASNCGASCLYLL